MKPADPPHSATSTVRKSGEVARTKAARNKALDMQQIFTWLLADGIVKKDEVKALFNHAQGIHKSATAMHLLTAVAHCKLSSALPPHRTLTLDWLTEWLAQKAGLTFFRIDPLKIDFTRVADVMSATYAARYNILPVELSSTELVIATAEPFSTDWVDEIARISRRSVRLVVANPLEIAQYIGQFFSLAKSIKDAHKKGGRELALRNNFEQLVEMGKANKQLDANDQHIINIVDWLWQYAFEQRASDIHLEPKRDVGVIRFPHRRCLASGLSGAGYRDDRHDRANQVARTHGCDRKAPSAGWSHQDAHG